MGKRMTAPKETSSAKIPASNFVSSGRLNPNSNIRAKGLSSAKSLRTSSSKPSEIQSKTKNSYSIYNITLDKNIKRLHQIAELDSGWDGYNARKFSKTLIERVERILSKLNNQPKIFPFNGGIQMEFYDTKDTSKYLEIGVTSKDILCNDEKLYMRDINKKVKEFYETH